jgi:hypothetical protein
MRATARIARTTERHSGFRRNDDIKGRGLSAQDGLCKKEENRIMSLYSTAFPQKLVTFLFGMVILMLPFANAYPPPGFDTMGADLELQIEQKGQLQTVHVSGQVVVQRGAPLIGIATTTIPIQITELHLTGVFPEATDSRVAVELNPDHPATGLLRQRAAGSEFGMDSFFDITYRFDFLGQPPLHTDQAMRLDDQSDTQTIPFTRLQTDVPSATPQEAYNPFHSGQTAIPLLDSNNQEVGIVRRARIIFWPWIDCYLSALNLFYIPTHPGGTPGTVNLTGMSRVVRSTCLYPDPAGEGSNLTTELESALLIGNGTRTIRLRESPTLSSTGRMRSLDPATGGFPVQSFFDIFTEITIDGKTYTNRDPIHLQSEPVESLPFQNTPHFAVNVPIPLYNFDDPPGAPPMYLIQQMDYTFVKPKPWWFPWWSIYIIKVNPFGFPIPSIPFGLFKGFGAVGDPFQTGVSDQQGTLDFLNLEMGDYSIKENLPPGYEPITPLVQDVSLDSIQYAPDFYKGFGGKYPCAGKEVLQVGLTGELEIPDQTGEPQVAQVTFNGTAEVAHRTPGDLDGNTRTEVDTEILAMNLTAPNPFGPGILRIRESPSRPSHGRLEEQAPNTSFPANSFFDIFVELELPAVQKPLSSFEPTHLEHSDVHQSPPIGEMHLDNGKDTEFKLEPSGPTLARLRKLWWVPLPWYEYFIIVINNPPTPTPSATLTATWSATPSPSGTFTITATETPTDTPTDTPTETHTPTFTDTFTERPTETLTFTGVPPTHTQTATVSRTDTRAPSPTFTRTPTVTRSRTATRFPTFTHTPPPPTRTFTQTRVPTVTFTKVIDPTFTETRIPTVTFTKIIDPTFTETTKPTETRIPTGTPTDTPHDPTATNTFIPTETRVPTPTHTFQTKPTETFTKLIDPTPTFTFQTDITPTFTRVIDPTSTDTFIPTETRVPTATFTKLIDPTSTDTFHPTETRIPTATFTKQAQPTSTDTFIPTETRVLTATFTKVIDPTSTDTFHPTETRIPTATFTKQAQPTSTNTFIPTETRVPTPTNTFQTKPTETFTKLIDPTPTFTFQTDITPTFTRVIDPTFTETTKPTETRIPTATFTKQGQPTATFTFQTDITPTFTRVIDPTFTNTFHPTETRIPTATFTKQGQPTATFTFQTDITPTFTRIPTETPKVTPTGTATERPTPSHTHEIPPTETPTHGPDKGALIYSIEGDTLYNSGASLAKEGDVLVKGTLLTIDGGQYEQLLVKFLADPEAEGKYLGLDGLDAISVEGGVLTRAFFSVERDFKVTNPTHPLFNSFISHGDLLAKSGLVVSNPLLKGPFHPVIPGQINTPDNIGLDGIDVEGVDKVLYDQWSVVYYATGGNALNSQLTNQEIRIYWSFEDINESYLTGPFASSPPGIGIPISADDVLLTKMMGMTGTIFRSGSDGIPVPFPSIMEGLFDPPLEPINVGLDGLDMPNYLAESDEAGETGPVAILKDNVLFSTEIEDPFGLGRFGDGDLMTDPPGTAATTMLDPNVALTGHPELGNLGLDGIDCLGDVAIKLVDRPIPCAGVFVPQNVNGANGPFNLRIFALQGCEIQNQVEISLEYPTFLFAINPTNGITPGAHFSLMTAKATKATATTELNIILDRTGNPTPGENLMTLRVQTVIGWETTHQGSLLWKQFIPDQGPDQAGLIPPIQISDSGVPSQPVLQVPDPILSTAIQALWFPNPTSEGVSSYTASILSNTGEVAMVTVSAPQTNSGLSGLRPGTDYTLQVIATNAQGDSQPATLTFTTRYDRKTTSHNVILERLSQDWSPAGYQKGTLQSAVPLPVDINLDGQVDSLDALAILTDRHFKE